MSFIKFFLAIIWGAGAGASLSFNNNISRYDVIWGGLAGGIGWAVYTVVFALFPEHEFLAYFWGALSLSLLCEVTSFFTKNPSTVYLVPALLPMVPGGGMFRTMRAAVSGEIELALSTGSATLAAAGAIALALACAATVTRIVTDTTSHIKKR